MAILAFQKPDKVLMLEADNTFGKFEFRPLEPGYGVTIGNALRRILLMWTAKKICPSPHFVLCSVSSPLGATFTNGENDHG